MSNPPFDVETVLPRELFDQICEIRVQQPQIIPREASVRKRRQTLTDDGRLVVVAADHPGRGVTSSGTEALGMADRYQYLGRILRVLEQPGVDGVMSTPDILEELLIVNHLMREKGQRPVLDGKVILGCMNRGGLSGAIFEMRDRFTAFTAAQIQRMRFDGAKMMFRLDWKNPDSGATIDDCSRALRELEALDLPAFLEPLPVQKTDSGYRVQKTADALISVIGVATALGNSSRLLWLKIPYVQEFERVVRAATCPILMLGGQSRKEPEKLLYDFAAGIAAGPNVRGVLVGRNVLFPGKADPAAMAQAVTRVVHEDAAPKDAAVLLKGSTSLAS